MCTVVNKYKQPYDVYIGRGSVWGNPFVMLNQSDSERTRVIESFRKYFKREREKGNITNEMLLELKGKALGCFCAPKACHGDVIKEAVDSL